MVQESIKIYSSKLFREVDWNSFLDQYKPAWIVNKVNESISLIDLYFKHPLVPVVVRLKSIHSETARRRRQFSAPVTPFGNRGARGEIGYTNVALSLKVAFAGSKSLGARAAALGT